MASAHSKQREPRVAIVHGWKGTPDQGWLAWLREQLGQRGVKVIAPCFESGEHPNAKGWTTELAQRLGPPDKETVLVGHSMGCYVILNYLLQMKVDQPLAGIVLVAGGAWGEMDWTRIRRQAKQRVVIHSDDDPLVEPERSTELAKLIDANEIVIPGRKHFGNFEDRPLDEALAAVLACFDLS